MLVIRPEQMEVFRRVARVPFENEMVEHSKRFSPRLSEVIGEDQLRVALRRTMDRAAGYGFRNRGPVRLCIELAFLFGSAFDTDPQYPWAGQILRASGDQMNRAEELHGKTLEYQTRVSGPGGANTRRALKELSALAHGSAEPSSSNFAVGMIREMTRIFPEKASYIGDAGLGALVEEGSAVGRKHRFPTDRSSALIVSLMFAFGHGCIDDPLYPWIARTLTDDKIVDPAARAERLEKKAVTWLDHVVSRIGDEAQP